MGCTSISSPGILCTPSQPCHEQSVHIWQKAVNKVLTANFPGEKLPAKIWKYPFKNAWATTEGTIDITENLLVDLNGPKKHNLDPRLVAVAAHEIAHLKLDHYSLSDWAKIKRLISYQSNVKPHSNINQTDQFLINDITKLSEKLDQDADRLAINYLLKAGYAVNDYINLLSWIQDNIKKNKHILTYRTMTSIKDRKRAVLSIKSSRVVD